jgi:hypothetical protein
MTTNRRYEVRLFNRHGQEDEGLTYATNSREKAEAEAKAAKADSFDRDVLVFDYGYLIMRAEMIGGQPFLLHVEP